MAEAQEKPFLARPLAIVTLVGGVLGLFATAVGIYTGLAGANSHQPSAAAPASTSAAALSEAARVSECQHTHGLSAPTERREMGEGEWYLRACSWPAPDGAFPDGLSEITLRSEPGPGQSEVEGGSIVPGTPSGRDQSVIYSSGRYRFDSARCL